MKSALKRLVKLITHNLGLKLLSLIMATLIWLLIINVSDPGTVIVVYNVPISIVDQEVLEDIDMVYEDPNATVNVTVSGKRSDLKNISINDFSATASLTELSQVNAVPVKVVITSALAGRVAIERQSVQTLTLNVEKIETQDYPVKIEFEGELADGYKEGNATMSRNTATVSAPVSVHDKINKVVAVCHLDQSDKEISQVCDLVLLDKHDNVIPTDNCEISPDNVTVNLKVYRKKQIQLNVGEIGKPHVGYRVKDVTLSADTVTLYGNNSTLASMDEIDVGTGYDISNITDSITANIDITNYIPEDLRVDGSNIIEMNIELEKLDEKEFELFTPDIEVKNLEGGSSVTYKSDKFKVTLYGTEDVLSGIKASDIKASIDLKGKGTGETEATVSLSIPDGTELKEQVNVKLNIK